MAPVSVLALEPIRRKARATGLPAALTAILASAGERASRPTRSAGALFPSGDKRPAGRQARLRWLRHLPACLPDSHLDFGYRELCAHGIGDAAASQPGIRRTPQPRPADQPVLISCATPPSIRATDFWTRSRR